MLTITGENEKKTQKNEIYRKRGKRAVIQNMDQKD
jgi:hypothetical protein